jgi:hypothetical protein
VSIDFDQLPEQWKSRLVRSYADKLAVGLAAVVLSRPMTRQLLSQAINAAFRSDMPEWIDAEDVHQALDRLIARMGRRGGAMACKRRSLPPDSQRHKVRHGKDRSDQPPAILPDPVHPDSIPAQHLGKEHTR